MSLTLWQRYPTEGASQRNRNQDRDGEINIEEGSKKELSSLRSYESIKILSKLSENLYFSSFNEYENLKIFLYLYGYFLKLLESVILIFIEIIEVDQPFRVNNNFILFSASSSSSSYFISLLFQLE